MKYSEMVPDDEEDGLYGVYVGVVKKITDPDNRGRIKVKFPWRDADDESKWARIAVPMAGKNMGTYFLPETGDEVLVAFGNGDIHDPYILGAMWTGKQSPPLKNKEKNPVRQIKSRAGHKLTFDDTDGKGSITIETPKGHTVTLDDANEKLQIEDKEGSTITMNSDGVAISTSGALSLEGKSISLAADKKFDIEGKKIAAKAKSKIQMKAKGGFQVKSKGMMKLQSKAMIKVKSSALLKMKGSMIMLN